MLKIVYFLLTVALFAQETDRPLEQQRDSIYNGTYYEMVSIQAVHADGTAARGSIACHGDWWKHQDSKNHTFIGGEWFPFETDSRGVVILNPYVEDFPEDPLDCRAVDRHGHTGKTRFTTPAPHIQIIVR